MHVNHDTESSSAVLPTAESMKQNTAESGGSEENLSTHTMVLRSRERTVSPKMLSIATSVSPKKQARGREIDPPEGSDGNARSLLRQIAAVAEALKSRCSPKQQMQAAEVERRRRIAAAANPQDPLEEVQPEGGGCPGCGGRDRLHPALHPERDDQAPARLSVGHGFCQHAGLPVVPDPSHGGRAAPDSTLNLTWTWPARSTRCCRRWDKI